MHGGKKCSCRSKFMERNSKALQADSWHRLSLRRLGANSPFTRSTSRRHCLRSERWLIVALLSCDGEELERYTRMCAGEYL